MNRFVKKLRRVGSRFTRWPIIGRVMARLVRTGMGPYTGAISLAEACAHGYISPDARIRHTAFQRGKSCFIGDGVLVYQDPSGGEVRLGDRVHLHENSSLQTGQGGSIFIGSGTHVQPRCQFSAYKGAIRIGEHVEIAPACAFYPYNHGTQLGVPIQQQPITSHGGIQIGDAAWLGYGVIVLDGARIGNGAVVAAGAVVTSEIPDNAIAAGVPARVIGHRKNA